MNKVSMSVALRKESGKGNSKRLRAAGDIPAIVYGGVEPIMITVNKFEFQKNFKQMSENVLIDLDIKGGEAKEVLIKDFQMDQVTNRLTHIDFYEIVRGKKINTRIPIELSGVPIGVRLNGGLFDQLAYEILVECLPKDIPEVIKVDITEMDLNDVLHISDLEVPEGVVFIDSLETVIAIVASAKAEEVESDSESDEDQVDETEAITE